jgi:AcrR family transcriptional regulator
MAAKPGPRERLLRAARELTYRDGMGVGVDAILREADAARRSLYEHFGGKSGLIAEVLAQTAADDERRYAQALAHGGVDPRARLLGLFDWLDEASSADTFRGCRFTTAELSLTDPDHPGHAVTRAPKRHVRDLLLAELRALGHPEPERAADQLQLLIEGVLVQAVLAPQSRPALAAKRMAELVLST